MKTNYLFPHKFKFIGLLILIPTILMYFFIDFKNSNFLVQGPEFLTFNVPHFFEDTQLLTYKLENLYNGLIGMMILISSLMIAFSKEKEEDEFIQKIRLDSLVWATYFNAFVLFLSLIFLYDWQFFWVMTFNMFTILWFFTIRFNFKIYLLKKTLTNEE